MKIVKFLLFAGALTAGGGAFAYKEGTTRKDATASVAKKFDKMDSNSDKKVSPAELSAFMAQSSAKRGEAADQAKADRRFKRLDTDGDGEVRAAELQAEELDKFDKADVNRNGKIDTAEAAD